MLNTKISFLIFEVEDRKSKVFIVILYKA